MERVLVIDDDELSREVLELLLSGEGYTVATAGSGDEALEMLEGGVAAEAPELVVMDMQMPGVSGVELARRLRALLGDRLRVLAMSGSRSAEGESGEFDGFLLKPFSMEEFEATREPAGEGVLRNIAAAEEQAGSGEVLDAKTFGSFRGMLGEGPLRELYGACLRDAGEVLGKMQAADSAGDMDEFRKSAHTIKGSLGMLGAREMEGMCARLERAESETEYRPTLEAFPGAMQRLGDTLIALGVQL